jgi:hypothetical protein
LIEVKVNKKERSYFRFFFITITEAAANPNAITAAVAMAGGKFAVSGEATVSELSG